MSRYNYFDDDQDDVLEMLREKSREATAAEQNRNHEKAELVDAIKAFSKGSGEKIKHVAHAVAEKNLLDELESIKQSKRIAVTLVMLLVVVLVFASMVGIFMHSINKENERISAFNADAAKVCSEYITKYGNTGYENLYDDFKVEGYRMTGLCYVREMDFDNDKKSELLLVYNNGGVYYTEVWGYNKKDFVQLYSEEANQAKQMAGGAWVTLYHNNNKYYLGQHSGDEMETVTLYAFDGKHFEQKNKCEHDAAGEAFVLRKKVNTTSFERIKLAVLGPEKAVATADLVADTVEGFAGKNNSLPDNGGAVSLNDAYYSIVSEHNERYGCAEYKEEKGIAYVDGLAVVDLVDFDGDDIDELLLIYRKAVKVRDADAHGNYISIIQNKYYCEVYRYTGLKAVLAYKDEGISNSLRNDADQYYILKYRNKLIYYCKNSFSTAEYGRIVNGASTAVVMNKGVFKTDYKAAYHTEYGYTRYTIDEKSVYKSTFNEKGYAIALFDEDKEYDSDVFKVTYLQRKKSKASHLDERVTRTEETIKKLHPSYTPNKKA